MKGMNWLVRLGAALFTRRPRDVSVVEVTRSDANPRVFLIEYDPSTPVRKFTHDDGLPLMADPHPLNRAPDNMPGVECRVHTIEVREVEPGTVYMTVSYVWAEADVWAKWVEEFKGKKA